MRGTPDEMNDAFLAAWCPESGAPCVVWVPVERLKGIEEAGEGDRD